MSKLRPVIIVLILAIAALVFYLRKPAAKGAEGYPGYGEGELVYVSSSIGGELKQLNVARGDQTKKGAELFVLDREEEQAARAEAEETLRETSARMAKAKLDFDRAKSLRDKRVIASQDYDTADQDFQSMQHALAAKQQALQQADWRLRQKAQTAPADGLVYDTYYRQGEWVPAGTPVLSMLPPEYMKVRFFVPEGDLGKMIPGKPIDILVDGQAEPLKGAVSFVSPKAEYTLPIIYSRENREKLVFLVEGKLAPEDAAKLNPGAPIEVRLRP